MSFTVLAQYPLNVQVTVAPPYPIRLSDFTAIESNVLINIQNSDPTTYSIALVGTLRNEVTGASISSDINRLRGSCITVPPGMTMLTGTDLRTLFNPDNLIFRGLTREQIRGDEALPEGRYTLCIQAMDCSIVGRYLSPVPSEPIGCAGFEVNYADPPVMISPVCESVVSPDDIQMTLAWTQVIPTRPGVMIDYSIRIVEVEPPTRNPFDALLSSPPVFLEEVSSITVYNLRIPDEVILERGRKYAIQITAIDESGAVAFRNRGRSEVCTFVYGTPSPGGGGFSIVPRYPTDGDVLPFSFFPIIVRYDPYDDQYNRFSYEFTIQSDRGYRDFKNDVLGWGFGPLESQRRATGLSDITQEQSQHIALFKNQTELGGSFRFNRGENYSWNADIEIGKRGSPALRAVVPATDFGVGMKPSILQVPANNDTVPPGSIQFRWQTAEAPNQLLPPFSIVQARGAGTTFFNGIVDERWVIEVSRQETFGEVLHTMSGRLGITLDLESDETTAKDELYKELEEEFTIRENGTYYWRVRWMNSPDNPGDNGSYASSPVWRFTITNDPEATTPGGETAEESGACTSNCLAEAITNRTANSGLTVGSDLRIGKFTMNVRSITSSASNRFTGEGVIAIPFLNNVRIQVEFTSIQYNSDNRVFSGTVKAKTDRSFVSEEMRTRAGQVLSMSETEARNLGDFISDGERLMSLFTGSREIGMPIGIDREIDGHRYVIGIVNMEFTPERGTLDAVMSFDFPNIGNRLIALGAKDICISPDGLGDEGRLYLARDWVLVQEGETQFAFKGSEAADTTQATYVSWDCRGFRCMQVRGQVTFPRSMFLPDNADGSAGEGNVNGTFGVKACRGNDWIAMITIDPFQVNGLAGWGWNASNAYLDFSDIENPPDFRLPEGHGGESTDARLGNTWQGFYMERIEVKLPPEFANNTSPDRRTSFGAFNTIIDGTGLTTSIRALNLVEISEGNFEGWGFAIDTLNVDFVSNTFTEAGMAGRIGMPIFEAGDHLKYRMALGFDDGSDEFSYQFRVFTSDTLNIPMWSVARMFFKPNSSIEIGLNDRVRGNHITATLHGGVHFVGDMGAIASVAFKGINFEGLYLSTYGGTDGRHFRADSIYFAHASPQKSASGFPVSIDNISLNINTPTRPGVEFDFMLNFSEGSTAIGASARFGVFANFNRVGDRFEVSFGGVDVGRIGIDVSVSVMKLEGELEFYRDDPTYGNGTRGNIRVELPMDISGELTAYFGTVGGPSRGGFGTRDYYAYWLVDGMITFPGVPIFSGFAIYGFGGGAYHHMTMADALPDPQSTQGGSGGRTSIRYVPDFNTGLGLKFAAVFGTHPKNEAFNMDVRLQAEFNSSFGLNFISVGGDGYFMASISERGDAKVWANINLMFDNRPADGPKFVGNFDVFVRVGDILHGAGDGNKFVAMEFYVDRHTWHMYMGTPENRSGLVADLKVIQARLTSYLMVGHGIPVALPPLPPRIQSVLGGSGGRMEGEAATSSAASSRIRSASDDDAYRSGEGFAFGTALALDAEFNFAIFYAALGLDLGFDLNFSKPGAGSVFCAETGAPPRGIDGWYIQGQVFAGLYGEMGVQVDLFFVKGRFPFIQLGAAAMMQGNFPDPSGFRGRVGLYYSVLGGMVEGRCNFQLEVGDKCTFVTPNPLSGMDFIADMVPESGSREQSCFSSPAVSFSLPVEKYLEFPVEAADGTEVVRTFYPYVETFEFRKVGSRQNVQGRYMFEANNTVLKFRLDEMLEGTVDYDVRIVIRAREHFPNGTQQVVKNGDGSTWQEERSVRFTTGPVPDYIPLDQVAFTYPVEGQYYFLKGERTGGTGQPGTGIMQLENPVNLIFAREIEGKEYKYFVRYIPVSGGDKVELDLSYSSGRTLQFPLPALENETMYAIQFVRKYVPPRQDPLARLGREIQQQQNTRFSSLSTTILNRTLSGVAVSMRTTGQQLVPGETVGLDEKLLYKFYFRTSRHNTLQQKLASANFTPTYVNVLIAEALNLKTYLQEPFDEFEVKGLYKNGRQVLKPLLALSDPWTSSYHNTVARPGIYDLQPQIRSVISLVGIMYPAVVSVSSLNTHGKGLPPRQTVSVSNNSRVTGPIQRWQIEQETRRNPEYNQGNTGTGLAASMVTQNNYGAASNVLNGVQSSYRGPAITTGPSSNFEFIMSTSAFVWVDFLDLQRTVGRAMSWSPGVFGGVYPVRNAVQRDPALLPKVNTLLRHSMINYRYTRGMYSLEIQYQWPRGANLYSPGTKVTRTFSY